MRTRSQLNIRIPEALRAELEATAQAQGLNLTELVVSALERRLGEMREEKSNGIRNTKRSSLRTAAAP